VSSIGLTAIKRFLLKNSLCLEFSISKNLVSQDLYVDYTSLLNYNNTVTTLDLDWIVISKPEAFTSYIKNQKTLRTLRARYCGMKDGVLLSFMKSILVLDSSNMISTLDVSGNEVTDKHCVKEIGRLIQFRQILENIIMDGCMKIGFSDNKETKDSDYEGFANKVEIGMFFMNANISFL